MDTSSHNRYLSLVLGRRVCDWQLTHLPSAPLLLLVPAIRFLELGPNDGYMAAPIEEFL